MPVKQALGLALAALISVPPQSADVVGQWQKAVEPSNPQVTEVSVKPSDTALLVLDVESKLCNSVTSPRCMETVPKIAKMIRKARQRGMPVYYSVTRDGQENEILRMLKPLKTETVVQSGMDKFLHTDLNEILQNKGVKRLIITGTQAQGTVLHTIAGAARNNFSVIIPVDGVSATDLYTEKAALWTLLQMSDLEGQVELTRFKLIDFK